jgi:hypothetical protein
MPYRVGLGYALSAVNTDDLPEAVPHRSGGDGEFVLAADLAARFWQFAKMISAAARRKS